MRPKSSTPETPSERLVRDIRRATRKQYSAEEKIRIVLDGLRGDADSNAQLPGEVVRRLVVEGLKKQTDRSTIIGERD